MSKTLMTKLHKAMIGAFVIVLLVLALYPYLRGDDTTAGKLLDHENPTAETEASETRRSKEPRR
jgi:hypothetical protein